MRSTVRINFYMIFFCLSLWPASGTAQNLSIPSFREAKKLAEQIHRDHAVTIYCPCHYHGTTVDLTSCGYIPRKDRKRARRLEWEHVVAAESFGQSFREWREGDTKCLGAGGKTYKGRRCAQSNSVFRKMEADLYNLWPVIGELNGLRSNYTMAEIAGPAKSFGGCLAKIAERKFEPMDLDKGIVARVHLYMDKAYPGHGIISKKNEALFAAWDKLFPATAWECERSERIRKIQGNRNDILAERCQNRNQSQSQGSK